MGRPVGLGWTRSKFVVVIGIIVLVDNSASETESVDGDDVAVGRNDADDSDRGSITGESLRTASVGWVTSDGGTDVTDELLQSLMMICR